VATLDILLVEHDEEFADLVADVLRSDGYRVFVVTNGARAVSLAAQLCPQVVVVDLSLPDTLGDEVVRELRRQVPASTAIVAVTALPETTHIADVDLILSRPVALQLFGGLSDFVRRCEERATAESTSR
jgi:DNA-binding response OmpR family regulator